MVNDRYLDWSLAGHDVVKHEFGSNVSVFDKTTSRAVVVFCLPYQLSALPNTMLPTMLVIIIGIHYTPIEKPECTVCTVINLRIGGIT